MVPPFRQIRYIFQSFELSDFLPQMPVNISRVNFQPELFFPRFGTTPKGLTTIGFSPGGSLLTSPSASISDTAPETNS